MEQKNEVAKATPFGVEPQIEQLEPLFLNEEFGSKVGRITAQKVFRVNIGAGRHYRNEAGQTFKSITTFLSETMPPNRFLNTWRENKIEELGTVQAAKEFVQSTADYGTGLHIAVADYCRNGFVDWTDFEVFAYEYLMSIGFTNSTLHSAARELVNDFASMLAFIHEYEVKVLAVEIPVFSADGFATLIDLVVEMNALNYTEKTPAEKRQRIRAIINLKSGKKGFFESHIFQLIGERRAFNETYSSTCGFQIDEVFNLAPNDWRTEPTFKLARQTKPIAERYLEDEFDIYVRLGKKKGILGSPTKTFPVFTGITTFGSNPVDQLRILSYEEFALVRLGALGGTEEPAQE